MTDRPLASDDDPSRTLRPLRRVRQFREFTAQPLSEAELDALADVARWSGSSRNSQPWRFIVIRDLDSIRRIGETGMPQTRSLGTATTVIAITLPSEPSRAVADAFDDGRVAERILIAASFLGLGAGIAWVRAGVRAPIGAILGLPADRMIRTIIALGHPTESARAPKSAPGEARLPGEEVIFQERWPSA